MILIAEAIHDAQRLKELQALPLERKIQITQTRIIEWYQHYHGQVCVSFSGGKDSTVLLHIARKIYPDIPAVFSNTGLEYPEIQRFVKSFDNVDIVTPAIRFDEVVSSYGYPLISKDVSKDIHEARQKNYKRAKSKFDINSEYCQKYGKRYCKEKWLPLLHMPLLISHLCCNKMKKEPIHHYLKANNMKQIVATLAVESEIRKNAWIAHGCNAFDSKIPTSQPMSFWTEQDVLAYIAKYGVEIAAVYGDIVSMGPDGNEYPPLDLYGKPQCNLKCTGCQRTGCIFCAFGSHLERMGETKFQLLARTHPRQYEYSIGGGQWVDNPHYDPTAPKFDGEWQNWNPKQIWVPSKKGLGMGKVFDMVNEIYGKDFYRYE